MQIHTHYCCNHEFGKPSDMSHSECATLPVVAFLRNGSAWAQSFWKPTEEELQALNAGMSIALEVRIGSVNPGEPVGHPVVRLGVTDEETTLAPQSGPCTKQVVTCTLVHPDGRRWVGENWVRNHQETCPRQGMPSGQGYELCRDVCQQAGHAEEVAVRMAGADATGCTAYVEGHSYICENCEAVLQSAGVVAMHIAAPPVLEAA
jgi:hypothetical protein